MGIEPTTSGIAVRVINEYLMALSNKKYTGNKKTNLILLKLHQDNKKFDIEEFYLAYNKSRLRNESKESVDKLASLLSDRSAFTIRNRVIYKKNRKIIIATKIRASLNDFRRSQQFNSKITPFNVNFTEKTDELGIPNANNIADQDNQQRNETRQKEIENEANTTSEFIDNLHKQHGFLDKYEIVTIDEFLRLNKDDSAELTSLLEYNNPGKLLKFTQSAISQNNDRYMLDKLIFVQLESDGEIIKLFSYKFHEEGILILPELGLNYSDEITKILNKIVNYDKQNNQDLEAKLKEIMKYLRNEPGNSSSMKKYMLLCHEILKNLNKTIPAGSKYPINSNPNYEDSMNTARVFKKPKYIQEPQIYNMQAFFEKKYKNRFGYSFNKNVLEINYRTIIVTNIITLTTIKIIKSLPNQYYAALDLECMLNLSLKDFTELVEEIKNTDTKLIIVYDTTQYNRNLFLRLTELAQATEYKEIIIITKTENSEIAQEYFLNAEVINDDGQSLNDLDIYTQKDIMNVTKVTFQGEEVQRLNLLIDSESVKFIQGTVLNEILNNRNVTIGKSLSNSKYEEIKHCYINRRIKKANSLDSKCNEDIEEKYKDKLLTKFDDISDDVVLITAEPGGGKSTLLTHLAVTTNKLDNNVWIFKINLLEHRQVLYNWIVKRIIVDMLDALQFISQVVVNNTELTVRLREDNDKVYLDGCTGDEWATFELNMFLHFYNERKVMFLFDGFDEICPFYKYKTINLLRIIMNNPRKHKMWVTSRPNKDVLPDLQRLLGNHYELIPLTGEEINLK